MNGEHLVVNGYSCNIQPSDQYSAVMALKINDSPVTVCFSKDERPELKQRIMKNLLDAYEQRRVQCVSFSG